jgi:hypothetical protein
MWGPLQDFLTAHRDHFRDRLLSYHDLIENDQMTESDEKDLIAFLTMLMLAHVVWS